MKNIIYALLFYFALIRNKQEITEEVQLDIKKIKNMSIEEFLDKTIEKQHEIAVLIEKEYHPFGKLFLDGIEGNFKYFNIIYDIFTKLKPEEKPNGQLGENETLQDSESKIDTPEEPQTPPTDDYKKLEYADKLYFELMKNRIQIYHFNFVNFLLKISGYSKIDKRNMFFIFFSKFHEDSNANKNNANTAFRKSLKTIDDINQLELTESERELTKKDLDAPIKEKINKLKGIIDNELINNDTILKGVLKNEEFKNELILFFKGKKKKLYEALSYSNYANSEELFDVLCNNPKLKENLIFYIRRRMNWDNYRNFYVFNDPNFIDKIVKKCNEENLFTFINIK